MWLTQLERLADPKYGLNVKFESGWKRRGASGGAQMRAVKGVLWHHDVSPRSGIYPLRGMLRDGRKGLSGPLCHIGFDRNGTVHVVGAGKANHAGKGIVRGVPRNAGNTRLIGIEMTSAGTRPWDWTDAQLREMPKLGAALNDIFGLTTSQHWSHKEYSSTGKIDPAGLPGGMARLRSRIGSARFGGGSSPTADPNRPWRTSPRVNGMSKSEIRRIQRELDGAGYDLGSYGADGSYGDSTGAAVKSLQTDLGVTADGVYGPATEEALMSMKEDVSFIRRAVVESQKRTTHGNAVAEENQKRIGRIPDAILDESVALKGDWEGHTGDLRGVREWYAHDMGEIKRLVRESHAATVKAVQEVGKAQGLTDAQVQAIAEAAAEASARVSAEDVAGQLEVGVKSEG